VARRKRHRNRWRRSWRTSNGTVSQEQYAAIGRRAAARDAILVELRARFSVAFDPERPLPLALCVHHQLCAALGVPRSQVDAVLQWRCAMPGYIAALAPVACDGSETGEISDEHRVHAGKQMEQATR
jgi:ProQ/FINO family